MRLTINGDVFGDLVLSGINHQIAGNQPARILQRHQMLQPARVLRRPQVPQPADPDPVRVLRRRQVPQPARPQPARELRRRPAPQPVRVLRRRPAPQPVRAPRRHRAGHVIPPEVQNRRVLRARRAKRYSCFAIPSHEDNPIFWDKVFKLPPDFLQYISPTCNLRAQSTTRRVLRDIILYFNPGYQLPLDARKSELVKTFQDLVICQYGKVYGF